MTDMTEVTATQTPTERPAPAAVVPAVEERVVITEQQVLFGSAPALGRTPARHWTAALTTVRGLFDVSREPARRQYPKRLRYLENALMSREMDRL